MNLFGLVLFVALEIWLVEYASSSSCQNVDSTLFADCVQAGYNVTELNPNTTQTELSRLIASMRSKFNNCSSLSSLMTCSVQLPKCPTAASTLPCKDVCRNFVSECQNSSSESDGLIALFRGICELLPSDKCLSTPNNLNNSASEAVKCRRLTIEQCKDAGYNFTSVSGAYQKMVQASAIFQDSDANSTLRKVICMEIAPPCDAKNNQTLIVPCRSMCDDAFSESQSAFVKVFKAQKYCSTFPEFPDSTTQVDGKEYCTLQAWPDNGYWPSGLWAFLNTTGQQPTPPTMATKTAPVPAVNATTPVPTTNTSKPVPKTNVTASVNVTTPKVTIPAATTNVTPPASKANATTPAPMTKVTTPTSTTNVTMPASSTKGTTLTSTANVTTPAPSTEETTPTSTPNVTTPASSTNETTPSSSTNVTTPASSTKETTPSSSTNVTTPASSTKETTPPSTTNVTTPASSTNETTPSSSTNVTTPASSTKETTPSSTTNVTTPASSTNETTPSSSTNVTTPASSTNETTPASTTPASKANATTPAPTTKRTTPTSTANGTKPASSTKGTAPATSTKGSKPAPTSYKSSTSSSSTPGVKGSTPPVVSASKGGKMSAGAIAGTVLGILVLLLVIVLGAIFFRRYHQTKSQYRHSLMVDMDEL